ncbi:MAG: hypothetical protein AAGC65_22855, partial [Mucilaginibacter sp.]|uniref:hypothetical protein n=1 Tax=Mucilaginibacter sp. TaxID=1882438 RepID=UPI0031A3B8CB
KTDPVDSLYTYDNNPSPRLAWVETYTYDDKPNYYKSGPDKALSLIYKDYYTMSANNIKTAKFTGYSASTVTVPVLINRSFTYEVDSKGLLTKSGVLIAQPQQQPSTITEYFYK